jgi:hypothetical protein
VNLQRVRYAENVVILLAENMAELTRATWLTTDSHSTAVLVCTVGDSLRILFDSLRILFDSLRILFPPVHVRDLVWALTVGSFKHPISRRVAQRSRTVQGPPPEQPSMRRGVHVHAWAA